LNRSEELVSVVGPKNASLINEGNKVVYWCSAEDVLMFAVLTRGFEKAASAWLKAGQLLMNAALQKYKKYKNSAMGAVASIEVLKPVDASDISQTGSLVAARAEVMRLRDRLGHLAKQAGFADVVYDASDLVLGVKESEDFDRCIAEIVHIRSALRLATQSQRRQTRSVLSGVNTVALEAEAARRRAAEREAEEEGHAHGDDDSSSSSSESEDN
jgi:hypothetical protein